MAAKPFVLLAQVSTKSEEKRKQSVDLLRPVAEFESKQEPCGSYVGMVPREGDNGTGLTVFETYDTRDYLDIVHYRSEPFGKVQENIASQDLLAGAPSAAYFTPKGGFLSRSQPPSLPLQDQFIWIARFKTHPGKRDEMMEAVLTHTANVERTEEETLSFLVLESTEDEVGIVLFERYTSKEYFENVHATSESMKEFRGKIQPLMAERVSGGYRAATGFVDKREALV